mgnify:CR=1 FL=1
MPSPINSNNSSVTNPITSKPITKLEAIVLIAAVALAAVLITNAIIASPITLGICVFAGLGFLILLTSAQIQKIRQNPTGCCL